MINQHMQYIIEFRSGDHELKIKSFSGEIILVI